MKHESDAIHIQQYLKQYGLDSAFQYRDTQQNPNCKGSKTIRLNHIKNKEYNCGHCERVHTNDNCIFLEIRYDKGKKKEVVAVRCFKHMAESKAKKV